MPRYNPESTPSDADAPNNEFNETDMSDHKTPVQLDLGDGLASAPGPENTADAVIDAARSGVEAPASDSVALSPDLTIQTNTALPDATAHDAPRVAIIPQGSALSALVIEAQVVDQLETVFDPEIPVNIYELGLIYGVDVTNDGLVTVTMTLTAPSCPAAQSIPAEIESKLRAIDGVSDVKIDITFDPPWEMSKMSDAARLQLGFM